MCPAWLLAVLVVVGGVTGAVSQCWDHPSCRDLDLDLNLEDCLQLCRSDLSAETPVIPGPAHLQAPPPPLSDPALSLEDSAPQTKRSYSMEHFRWGKPVDANADPSKSTQTAWWRKTHQKFFPAKCDAPWPISSRRRRG
ncbi:hypothetical protein WMY93_032936 [Mugilogobius chulae]|uniref:Adrenocorticotropic hormone n=1 Tax=Mugilogobius chulae TaxID=88201 RepID=A0AAW0MUW7_9GOBI